MRDELEKVSRWAQSKIDAGAEPPWAWYQYMKLIETCDAILMGMAATATTGSSPRSESQSGAHLRLVDATYPQDVSQLHHAGLPVQMPM
jgi:hypothetical protein